MPTKQTKRTIIIDNYDSFTYNIVQYIEDLGGNPMVFKNDTITLAEIKLLQPTHIILSPGPGTPKEKKDIGICKDIITELGGTVPILGICLGHQAIAFAFGADIINAPEVMHGKTSLIKHVGASALFHGIPQTFEAMRYHSLIVNAATLPPEFRVTAVTSSAEDNALDKNICMAIEHSSLHLYGVQFHPESMATPIGKDLLENFLRIRIARTQSPHTLATPHAQIMRTSPPLHQKSAGTMFRKHAGLTRWLPGATHRPAVSNQKSAQPSPVSTRKKLHEIALNLLGRLSRRAGKSTAGKSSGNSSNKR